MTEFRLDTRKLLPNDSIGVRIFPTPAAFRAWLEKNHARGMAIWVGIYNNQTKKKSMTYTRHRQLDTLLDDSARGRRIKQLEWKPNRP